MSTALESKTRTFITRMCHISAQTGISKDMKRNIEEQDEDNK